MVTPLTLFTPIGTVERLSTKRATLSDFDKRLNFLVSKGVEKTIFFKSELQTKLIIEAYGCPSP